MSLDVCVTHEPAATRVRLRGPAPAGRVLSFLQLLAIDSAAWPRDGVLLDLREVEDRYDGPTQQRIACEAALVLRKRGKVAILAEPGTMQEGGGARVFTDEDAALRWLAQP